MEGVSEIRAFAVATVIGFLGFGLGFVLGLWH